MELEKCFAHQTVDSSPSAPPIEEQEDPLMEQIINCVKPPPTCLIMIPKRQKLTYCIRVRQGTCAVTRKAP